MIVTEGVNYFFEGSDFVVKGGCKGVFTVCYKEKETTPAPLTTTEAPKIVCKRVYVKTVDNQPGRVEVVGDHSNPVDIVHVHVWDQISEIKCVEWLTYFYFENFIVAKKGCQATFKVCYKEKEKTTTPAPLTTTPEPEICKKYKVLRPTRETIVGENSLPVDISSVALEREISRHVCKEGDNYFFEGSDFVVKRGCKELMVEDIQTMVQDQCPLMKDHNYLKLSKRVSSVNRDSTPNDAALGSQ
ncbi:capsulin [Elysia marginata]|uniref:Capsulin n=1 Tax=Elysia marginata TaxID=1093978 RepID=A0AAV4F1V1_9GAST|nr:capsulin [Elysia marginata]